MPHLIMSKLPMMPSALVGVVAFFPLTVPEVHAGMPSKLPSSRDMGISGYRRMPVDGTRSLRRSKASLRDMAKPFTSYSRSFSAMASMSATRSGPEVTEFAPAVSAV